METRSEVVLAAQVFYDSKLKAQLEPEHIGKFLVIYVTHGDFEMDESSVQAELRIMKRHPIADRFIMRIGYPAAHRMGFRTIDKR